MTYGCARSMRAFAIAASITAVVAGCGPKRVELQPETEDLLAICTAGLTLERERAYRAEWAARGGGVSSEESTRTEGGRTFNLQGLEGDDAVEGFRLFMECARDVLADQRASRPATQGNGDTVAHSVLGWLTDGTEIVQDPAPARVGDFGIVVIKGIDQGQLTSTRLSWYIDGCGHRRLGSNEGPYMRFQSLYMDQCRIRVWDPTTGEMSGSWQLWVE